MGTSFSTTDYAFNGNVSLPANAALGIFSAQSYSTTYGTGGDDTAAIQAAINAATVAGGAVAFLPPPSSGYLNISATLIMGSNGTCLVGASPNIKIRITAGSNLDWAISTGVATAVDYRTVHAVNTRTQTFNAVVYNVYDITRPVGLSTGGGIYNVMFVGDSTQTIGLGLGVMLNGAQSFVVSNTQYSGFIGEDVSLWDSFNVVVSNTVSTSTGPVVGVHRACYDVSIVTANSTGTTSTPYRAYAEQFTVASVTTTYSPLFTKFVDCHAYCSALQAEAFDLQGAAYVNLTGCTGDNVTTVINSASRYSIPCYQVLSDIGAQGGAYVDLTSNQTINGIKTFGTEVIINGNANQGAGFPPIYIASNADTAYQAYEFGIGIPGATGNWAFGADSSFSPNGSYYGANGSPVGTNFYCLYIAGDLAPVTHKFDNSGNFVAMGNITAQGSVVSTTPIAASSGGTGLASPGTSGNVLTSNGSTWTSAALASGTVVTVAPSSLAAPTTAKYGSSYLATQAASGLTVGTKGLKFAATLLNDFAVPPSQIGIVVEDGTHNYSAFVQSNGSALLRAGTTSNLASGTYESNPSSGVDVTTGHAHTCALEIKYSSPTSATIVAYLDGGIITTQFDVADLNLTQPISLWLLVDKVADIVQVQYDLGASILP